MQCCTVSKILHVFLQEVISSFMNELEKLYNLTDPATEQVKLFIGTVQ